MKGVVHRTGGGVYRVVLDGGEEIQASIRGRLKRERRVGDSVVIGDRVRLARTEDAWTIEGVDERETQLVRRGRGRREAKVVAANLTRVFAVVSALDPRSSLDLVDRLLVVCEASGLRPRLIVNKLDLDGARELADEISPLYRGVGYQVFALSARTGEGLESLEREICSGTSALVGPSGAGKSSLLNALDPGLGLRTGELSRKSGTGRHTTVAARLIPLGCGGLVADTPGFGDIALWRVPAEDVGACFPELAEPASRCRFRGCAHLREPDCGVRSAVAERVVAESRYQSYVRLREEAASTY